MIHIGDCLEVMRTLEACSVDAVVTDPPYGLEFMGKEWDAPWKKAGETAGKRTGFGDADGTPFRQNRGTPSFGVVGNPTCLNCGGDKYRNGARKCTCEAPCFPNQTAIQMRAFEDWCGTWARECLRVAKPGAYLAAFGGTRTFHRLACALEDAGWEIRDTLMWIYGSGFPKSHNGPWGGTALKPAWEPIVLARKPLAGTVEANWQRHGTGALNIDGCRIGWPGGVAPEVGTPEWGGPQKKSTAVPGQEGDTVDREPPSPLGRWPANVVHDGSEEVIAALPKAVGQQAAISGTAPSAKTSNVYGRMVREGEGSANSENAGSVGFKMRPGMRRIDEGSAARFFYCAKASREDRNDGCDGGAPGPQANNHPTVKPTDLMRWLCRLVTPAGGVVLDPFTGSGSTGRAAVMEGMQFIGIELDPDYAAIAEARIRAVQPGLPLDNAA